MNRKIVQSIELAFNSCQATKASVLWLSHACALSNSGTRTLQHSVKLNSFQCSTFEHIAISSTNMLHLHRAERLMVPYGMRGFSFSKFINELNVHVRLIVLEFQCMVSEYKASIQTSLCYGLLPFI